MRLARTYISVIALALGWILMTGNGAGAASLCPPGQAAPQYPPGLCQLVLSPSSVQAGSPLSVSGSGYAPGSTVTVRLGAVVLGTATTDGSGRFSQSFIVPSATNPGSYVVLGTGIGPDGTPYELRGTVQVLAAGTTAPVVVAPKVEKETRLPRTGTSPLPATAGGIGLTLLGAGALVAARRRKLARD